MTTDEGPSAKIICDSLSEMGHRLTTFEVRFHRFVLAEFNTHRVFSRNSASSRAIPLKKQLERVNTDAAVPVVWPAEQAGMQGGDELSPEMREAAAYRWNQAKQGAVHNAQLLGEIGVHKSIANRLLEPFMWHTVVVTSTAWENFFRQRCSPLAQPEIRVAAELMRKAYVESTPRLVVRDRWHLPYIDDATYVDVVKNEDDHKHQVVLCQVSAARCARVSYLTQDGVRDYREDVKLYGRLVSADPMHASPLEHVATPWGDNVQTVHLWQRGTPQHLSTRHELRLPRVGNFIGWRQLRLDVELERGWQSFS